VGSEPVSTTGNVMLRIVVTDQAVSVACGRWASCAAVRRDGPSGSASAVAPEEVSVAERVPQDRSPPRRRGRHDPASGKRAGCLGTALVWSSPPNAQDWAHAYYGKNYDRRLRIKAKYDRNGFFRFDEWLPG
jgi:hypothetical protein